MDGSASLTVGSTFKFNPLLRTSQYHYRLYTPLSLRLLQVGAPAGDAVHVSLTCIQIRSQWPRPRHPVVDLHGLEPGGLHLPSSLLLSKLEDVMCQVKVLHSDL